MESDKITPEVLWHGQGKQAKSGSNTFVQLLHRFAMDAGGNMALVAALTLPVFGGAGLIAIELSHMLSRKTQLQAIADEAAISAARELRLGNATADVIVAVARNHVEGAAAGRGLQLTFEGIVSPDKKSITINLTSEASLGLASSLGLVTPAVAVTAGAKLMGGAPVCSVILNASDKSSLYLEKSARLEAPQCSVFSNSKHTAAIGSKESATVKAAFICSAGGYEGASASYQPVPETDCPAFPDPLASRPAPSFGACDPAKQNLNVSGTGVYLTPGTYCGGLTISANTDVTLQPGIYVIKDGPLVLEKNVKLQGIGVGLYFTGSFAGMNLKKETSISLTAPKSGPMAGLLIYQDRSTTKIGEVFEISSDDAGTLLGTIYLPRGHLFLGGDKPVAQKSAYTIVVTNKLFASAGPTLVLNSDYAASDVPVPNGLGPLAGQVGLQ